MTRVQLLKSRTTWRRREIYRYRRWRHYVKAKPAGDPLRAKWHGLWDEAHTNRVHRDRQLAAPKQPVTHIDAAGYDFIRREEGSRNRPYNDSERNATVGIGHLIHKGPVTAADLKRWTLTDAEVETLFRKDVARFEAEVRKSFQGSPFARRQAKFNACVSLAFNIGTGGYAKSTVAQCVRSGDEIGAAAGFMLWIRPVVLFSRRSRERALFISS